VSLKRLVLHALLFLAISPVAIASTCPDFGYFEKLVEPAKMEDGFVKIKQYYFQGAESWVHEAEYEIMTVKEYEALDDEMTYKAYFWEGPKIGTTRIEPVTDIADYDLVRTIDGNSFYRPLEEQLNQKIIETHHIETPRRRKSKIKRLKRPEPQILKDGRLKVMVSPMHYEGLANGGQKAEVWSHYIKSRTPAIYQQVKCNEDKF
jgi:hypothetical protein